MPRRLMHDQYIRYVARGIDCGNHEHGGQVAIGNRTTGWYTEGLKWGRQETRTSHRAMTYQPKRRPAIHDPARPNPALPDLLTPDPEGLKRANWSSATARRSS